MKKIIRFVFNLQTRNEYLDDASPSAWMKVGWFIGRTTRNLFILALFVASSYVSAKVYNKYHPEVVYAKQVEVVTIQATSTSPVMERIAQCESSNTQIDPKTGQIIMHANTDGTIDLGRYQINVKTWGKKASDLGLDLTRPEDNEKMAYWIYENRGTGDWYSSASCWNK